METSQIKYLGLSANTSDYECHDGELSAAVNLINEDGHLKPLPQPKEVLNIGTQLGVNSRIVYIHTTATFRHYIIHQTNYKTLSWADADASSPTKIAFKKNNNSGQPVTDTTAYNILRISSIGKTLIILTSDGIFYFNFKPDLDTNGNYKSLGQKPPMLNFQFGVSSSKKDRWDRDGAELSPSDQSTYSYAISVLDNPVTTFFTGGVATDKAVITDHYEEVNNAIWALINKANSLVSKRGHFYAPFFVRYCYRLYDGSTLMHSAPVFLPLSTPQLYHAVLLNIPVDRTTGTLYPYHATENITYICTGETGVQTSNTAFAYDPLNVALEYHILNGGDVQNLFNDWGDIVKSVDVYVSNPLVRETQETFKEFVPATNTFRFTSVNSHPETYPWKDDANYPNYNCALIANIPLLSEDDWLKKIQETSAFFKVRSFRLPDLSWTSDDSDGFHEVTISPSVLPNLSAQESLTDDYNSHNYILPFFKSTNNCASFIFPYNNRLNISAISERLFHGFPVEALLPRPYTNMSDNIKALKYYVYIDTEQGQRIVDATSYYAQSQTENMNCMFLYICPLFFPDNRASKMEILVVDNGTEKIYRLPMTQHPFLNGSVTEIHLSQYGDYNFTPLTPSEVTIADTLSLPNYVYSSEVNNPFLFRPENIHTVGTGLILGIAAATKALSQGQFGQFPLYAFASDGVWALSVNTDGSFNTIQPVSRDVCTNPDSITSIDNAVLFATSRGIMLIQGSDTVCITDSLLSDSPFALSSLPQLTALLTAQFGWQSDHLASLFPQFSAFLDGVRIVYDYTNQRIFLYNPTEIDDTRPDSENSSSNTIHPLYYFAFVYSLKSQLWSSMKINIAYSLNSYPDALAVSRDNNLLSFDDSEIPSSGFYQLLISRPLKLGMSDTYKTINSLIQRGIFTRGNVHTLLYASRDLMTWYLIASSVTHEIHNLHGSPWKYYRIVTLAHNLTADNSLSGASIIVTPKFTNRLH